MAIFIVEEESSFTLAQKVLTYYCQASAIIHPHSKTFRLIGQLDGPQVEQFMQVCQEMLSYEPLPEESLPHQIVTSVSQQPVSSKHKDLVDKTCHYIQQHLEYPLTLNSISKAMNTNRNSLSKAFKKELNMGVSTWLRKQRMEKAWQLLVDTNLSIQEISVRLGYPSQANFATSFKSLFKQSPMQIRREPNVV